MANNPVSSERRIPFNRPYLSGNEFDYIREAVESGHIAGDGKFTRRCHELLQQVLGVPRVLLTTSCTDALEMSALLVGTGPGDEVIVPSFTFPSSIGAFVLRGAKPVFCDIRPDTLNLDETLLEGLITPRTKAIVVVHYGGVGCEMDAIMAIAHKHHVSVVEDNAHGLFARYKGRLLGTFGRFATQSFHETKNLICGEGGALLINDPSDVQRAEIIREKGTDRSRFFRGEVDKYTWVDIGSSFLPSDLLAAFLYAQLEERENIQKMRQQVWDRYHDWLADWAGDNNVGLPVIPEHCEQPWHLFYVMLPTEEQRDALMFWLKERGVLSVFHYIPLHLSEMGLHYGGSPGLCPVTESVSGRVLRLPFYNDLSLDDQQYVVDRIREFSL